MKYLSIFSRQMEANVYLFLPYRARLMHDEIWRGDMNYVFSVHVVALETNVLKKYSIKITDHNIVQTIKTIRLPLD